MRIFSFVIIFLLSSCQTNKPLRNGSQSINNPTGFGAILDSTNLPPVRYRFFKDDANARDLFLSAEREFSRDINKSIKLYNSYLDSYPNGEYADKVLFKLGKYFSNKNNYQQALNSFSRLALLDPPSKYRGLAYYNKAKVYSFLGKNKKAVKSLSKVRIDEINLEDKKEFFTFWAATAIKSGAYLQSVLANLKTLSLSPSQVHSDKIYSQVKSIVASRLSLEELKFLEREYSSSFPIHEVRLKIASVFLNNGDSQRARSLILKTINLSPPNSEVAIRAQSLLTNIGSISRNISSRKIGIILPLSGSRAKFGEAYLQGINLGLKSLVDSSMVELIITDSGADKTMALNSFNELVKTHGVLAIIGGLSGKVSEVVAQNSSRYQIPFISLSSRLGILNYGNQIFQFALTPELEVEAIIKDAINQKSISNFAILYPADSFGDRYAQAFMFYAKKYNIEVTAAESYVPSTTDFKESINNLIGINTNSRYTPEFKSLVRSKEAKLGRKLTNSELRRVVVKPDVNFEALFIPDTYKSVGQIIPALKYSNIDGVQFYGPATWNNPRLLKRAGQYLTNSRFVDVYSFGGENGPMFDEFLNLHRGLTNSSPNKLTVLGYDLGLSIANLYNNNSINSKDDFFKSLSSLNNLPGALGIYNWSTSKNPIKSIQLFEISRGVSSQIGSVLLN